MKSQPVKTWLRVTATLAFLLGGALPAAAVPADRWLEMDLYWFNPADVQTSAERFWTRYAPL